MVTKKRWLFLSLILAVCLLALGQTWGTCVRVVDGDTIVLDGQETVRLIGVDTPETKDPRKPVEAFGQEAYEFTRSLVEGKKVRLEFDQERIDKYGRTLAYVYLDDGTFVNAQIILQGYGHAYTEFPFKYMKNFRSYERMARERGLGLWGQQGENPATPPKTTTVAPKKSTASNGNVTVYITRTGAKYHSSGCRYLSRSLIPISLKDAVARGYTPCSVCNPPRLK
jgi:micrococcal nuclease